MRPRLPVFVAISWLAWVTGFETRPSWAADAGIEESIQTIRNRYAEVDRDLERCQQIKRDLVGYSVEGGELTTYLLNSSVRKMVARLYGERGRAPRNTTFGMTGYFSYSGSSHVTTSHFPAESSKERKSVSTFRTAH